MKSITFFFLISIALFGVNTMNAQEVNFRVEASSDTILQGNVFKLKFVAENTQGQFEAPSLEDWNIVGGPNTSNQFSMINGETTQYSSYEYILQAPNEGQYFIEAAQLSDGEQVLETNPLTIIVVPNPEGIQVTPKGYGYRQEIRYQTPRDTMSAQDSLAFKLRKLKSTKI